MRPPKLIKSYKFFDKAPLTWIEEFEEFMPPEVHRSSFDPVLLIIVGLFAVGGVYVISQMTKTKKDPPTPPKPKPKSKPLPPSNKKGSDIAPQAQISKEASPCIRKTPSVVKKAIRHGLCNIGNTCYMNSVLQCLFHLRVFTNYFTKEGFDRENKQTDTLAHAFYSLATKTRSEEFTKKEQKTCLHQVKSRLAQINPSFSSNKQQDALECLKTLLEGINKELNRVSQAPPYRQLPTQILTSLQDLSNEWFEDVLAKENSIVTDVFYGQILNKTACKECQKRKFSFDTFSSLSLGFNESRQGQEYSLENLLQHFLEEEDIKGKVFCQKCGADQDQITKSCLWRLPKILVIHFKRFKSEGDEYVKIASPVSFPTKELDLKLMIADSKDPSAADCKYTLCGVIDHFGTLNNGHYTANCMDDLDRKWYHFNDRNVESVRQESERKTSKDAYILFYVKTSSLSRST